MKKVSLLLKFMVSQDYRDYRYVRTLHIFDLYYYAQLLQRYLPDSYQQIPDFEDPLWMYFITARDELAKREFPLEAWQQCCDPHPLFDTYYYVSRNRDRIGKRNPFAHYLIKGWKQGLQPSPFFDQAHYAALSGWSEDKGDPLTHYVHYGGQNGTCPALSFNNDMCYVDQAPYPEIVHTNVIRHYKLHGSREGKSPTPVFNAKYYLDQLGDDSDATGDPFLHYLCAGEKRGIRPNQSFDVNYYRNRYLGTNQCESPLLHYYKTGVHEKAEINERIEQMAQKPVISIVVPVYNPEVRYLKNCIRSVLYQSYPYWELCLVDDCSDNEAIRDVIRNWTAVDNRISCRFNRQNSGISSATQSGIESVCGEFIGFLDNDDELEQDCLFQVARAINETNGKIFYTDEDLVGDDGSRLSIFYKPAFNKALLYSHNYITHFVVASRSLIIDAGGLISEFDGAQDYDLLLRLSDTGEAFYHIPHVLYHWRAIETSTSIDHERKPYAHEAGRKALTNCLKRNNLKGHVIDGPVNFHYRVELAESGQPSVTVIIGGNDAGETSVEPDRMQAKSGHENTSFHWIDRCDPGGSKGLECNMDQPKTSKAQAVQEIVECSKDEYVAILGHGVSDLSQNWLYELLSKMNLDQEIGIVCGRVSYNGTDGPSFAVPEMEKSNAAYYAAFIDSASRHSQGLHNMQWVNGCDWHICLISRKLIDQIGGFDYQRYPDLMAMHDLSYRAIAAGKKVLYTPDAVITLPERGYDQFMAGDEIEKESAVFKKSHYEQIMMFERFYNIGQVLERGYSRETFYRWLAGSKDTQGLTEQVN